MLYNNFTYIDCMITFLVSQNGFKINSKVNPFILYYVCDVTDMNKS